MTTPEWFSREVVAPVSEAEKGAVRVAQRLFRLAPTGEMDAATVAALRGLQRLHGLPCTGVLDLETAKVIDSLRPWQLDEDRKV